MSADEMVSGSKVETEENYEANSSDKLVPVGEAIRYRKRAQVAEKQTSEMSDEMTRLREENDALKGRLGDVEVEQELLGKLSGAGVNDLEAAMLMAKKRMDGRADRDVDAVVGQLQEEKGYLFDALEMPAAAGRTSGVKDKTSTGRKVLESTARRAAQSGSRADVQEYLRLRRQQI